MESSKARANKRLQVSTPTYRANYDQVFAKPRAMCQASDDCPGIDCDDCANQEPARELAFGYTVPKAPAVNEHMVGMRLACDVAVAPSKGVVFVGAIEYGDGTDDSNT